MLKKLKTITHVLFFGIMLVMLTGCESRRTIVHDLSEAEANNIVVFLANKGITATKVKAETGAAAGAQAEVMWNISVSTEDATQAMAILNAAGLPKRRGQTLLNIFSKGSALVPSELEEKIRYQAGLAEQIASTIRKIDGVLDADVQLSIPEQDPLNPGAPRRNVTASVYVKHTGVLDDPNTQLIPKIRRLVASSIQDLSFENVTVIPDRARFSDAPFAQTISSLTQDRDVVSVWTVLVARESLTRFRIIFFGFILLLLMFFAALIWVVWKFFPILEKSGGFSQLFTTQPFSTDELEKPKKSEGEEEEKEKDQETGAGEPDLEGAEGGSKEEPKGRR